MLSSSYYKRPGSNLVVSEVTTRIGIFLGLDFTTSKNIELNSNKYLSSIPSFSFSNLFSKVLIDYSNSENETDKSLLAGLFSGLTAGTTFNISSASYTIDGLGSEANLGGTYEFLSFVGNVIAAKPIVINNKNDRLFRYEPDYFINPPQFGLSLTPQSKETEYVIVNALGTDKINSFSKFGIYPGDKIKITGTQYNNTIFTVKSVTVNKDGSENLVVNEGFTAESSFGSRVGIELIQKRKGTDNIIAATGPVSLGTCGVYINGQLVSCYDNQTYSQCVARTRFENSSDIYWDVSLKCSQISSVLPTTATTLRTGSSTNPLSALSSLGYFSSTNSINVV